LKNRTVHAQLDSWINGKEETMKAGSSHMGIYIKNITFYLSEEMLDYFILMLLGK
jgi:hypothetical protein